MKQKFLVLFCIIVLAAFLRLWQLGTVPFGITHDEIGYIYNAYSLAKTGKNVHGEFLPFLTWLTEGFPYMPVPIYVSSLVFFIFPLSATTARLFPALLGILDIFLVYVLVQRLFNNKPLALFSSLFLAISPWHILVSRSAYDTNFSSFFFLLGIICFTLQIPHRFFPLLSPFFFFLAIFSYRGMNAVFPGIVILLLGYAVLSKKFTRQQLFTFLIGIGIVISLFIIVAARNAQRGYVQEALINKVKMQEFIDTQIREAQGPLWIRRLYLNKATYILSKWRENYLESYSLGFLFLRGESDKILSIWSRGKFYVIDLLFIFPGIYFLFKKNKNGAIFVVSLLLLSGLPGMVGGPIFSSRNFLLSLFFPVLTAGGVLFFYNFLKPYKIIPLFITLISMSYIYVLGSFLFDYYGRFAYYAAEPWFQSVKQISSVINKNKTAYKTVLVGNSSIGELLQYAFYAKIDPSLVQKAVQKGNERKMTLGNITFTGECIKNEHDELPTFNNLKPILYIVRSGCIKNEKPLTIFRDYAGNPIWDIYSVK